MTTIGGGSAPMQDALSLIAALSDPNAIKARLEELDARIKAANDAEEKAAKASQGLSAANATLKSREDAFAKQEQEIGKVVEAIARDQAAQEQEAARLEQQRVANVAADSELGKLRSNLDAREAQINSAEKALDDREAQIACREDALSMAEQDFKDRAERFRGALAGVA